MSSNHVTDLLPAFLDNALDEGTAKLVKSHLELCSACRKEEELLTESWSLLGSLETIEPSPSFRARFWERVRSEEEARFGWRDFISARWKPLAAGLLATWIIGVTGGVALYEAQGHRDAFPSARAIDIFASPYPMNSIEAAYLSGGHEKEGSAHP